MVAKVDIVNVALRLVGDDAVTSLTDGSPGANAAGDLYDESRKTLLRSHPWNFATKRQKLARSSTDPAYEYEYAYVLPSDWIRTIAVHNNDNGVGTVKYAVEVVNNKRCVLADAENIYLRYVADTEDPNIMPSDFRRALEYSLARDLAGRIATSNTLAERYAREADRALARARSTDGQGAFPERRPPGSWLTSRFRFGPNTTRGAW